MLIQQVPQEQKLHSRRILFAFCPALQRGTSRSPIRPFQQLDGSKVGFGLWRCRFFVAEALNVGLRGDFSCLCTDFGALFLFVCLKAICNANGEVRNKTRFLRYFKVSRHLVDLQRRSTRPRSRVHQKCNFGLTFTPKAGVDH